MPSELGNVCFSIRCRRPLPTHCGRSIQEEGTVLYRWFCASEIDQHEMARLIVREGYAIGPVSGVKDKLAVATHAYFSSPRDIC